MLTRSLPRGASEILAISASAFSISLTMRWQRSKNSAPASVKLMRRVLRLNSLTPNDSSSLATLFPTAEADIPSRSPAATKLCSSAARTKANKPLRLSICAPIRELLSLKSGVKPHFWPIKSSLSSNPANNTFAGVNHDHPFTSANPSPSPV
ncbi:hypothetical protein D3C80_1040910 [compost metagenome]